MNSKASGSTMKHYVPSKSLMVSSAQHQHLMSLYNLPTHDEPRPMCGQGLITKMLKKSDSRNQISLEQQGLFSMELAADSTESEGGTSGSVPQFIMKMNSEERKRSQKQKQTKESKEEDSPCSRTSLSTQDLAQLSHYSNPTSETASTIKSNDNTAPLRVCVAETSSGNHVPCALGDNLSSHGSADTGEDSLVSNMKTVMEEQQKALVQMAEQNRQFKEALMQYNAEIYQLREEKAEQKIRMAQLVLKNETFETQSVVLRSEIVTLKTMLDEMQDDELRRRFESLLDDDSVCDQEMEDKILAASSYESTEDDLFKVAPPVMAEQADTVPSEPMSPMATVTDKFQKALSHFDPGTTQSPDRPPSNLRTSQEDLFIKARRALSRKVAEESPRAALAPRSMGENGQIRRQTSGVMESIEVALDDDQETVFTALSTISGEIKNQNSANAYKSRLGEIKKKRQERASLPAVFETEIGKKYEA